MEYPIPLPTMKLSLIGCTGHETTIGSKAEHRQLVNLCDNRTKPMTIISCWKLLLRFVMKWVEVWSFSMH